MNNDINKRIENLETQLASLKEEFSSFKIKQIQNKITILVFSGDLDKVLPAFIIAAGAAAMDIEVVMYFTFWGINAIRKKRILKDKKISEKLLSLMTPQSLKKLPLSKNNMLGIGPIFLKHMMKENNVVNLQDLINLCLELKVKMVSCQMTMGIMGITKNELIQPIEYGGVSSVLNEAMNSKFTLFI